MAQVRRGARGVEEMRAKLRRVQQRYPDRIGAALYAEGQIEMTEAKRRTPVWNTERPVPKGVVPGALRASGVVSPPQREGRRIFVRLSFGGAAVNYAVYVHEDPDAFHQTGQWKYLESVLDESRPHMAGRIGRRIHLGRLKVEEL